MAIKDRYLITGGSGMLGSAFKYIPKYSGDYIYLSSKQCDLRSEEETKKLFFDVKPDYVFHLAAKVGGIKSNFDYMADFFVENIRMNINVLQFSKEVGVKKLVSVLSTCIYPGKVTYPITEDQLHNGFPHDMNYGYAYAKRMLDVQSKAFRKQYGCNFITVVSNNLFGQDDNFDLNDSHVIPAIIRKLYEAKKNNLDKVSFWGNGEPLREFTYARDFAQAMIFAFENYNEEEPLNLGNTEEYTIKSVVMMVANMLQYKGEIEWDESKPNGQMKKPSSNQKLLNLGWDDESYTPFNKALKKTIDWFKKNYPNVRGI